MKPTIAGRPLNIFDEITMEQLPYIQFALTDWRETTNWLTEQGVRLEDEDGMALTLVERIKLYVQSNAE